MHYLSAEKVLALWEAGRPSMPSIVPALTLAEPAGPQIATALADRRHWATAARHAVTLLRGSTAAARASRAAERRSASSPRLAPGGAAARR